MQNYKSLSIVIIVVASILAGCSGASDKESLRYALPEKASLDFVEQFRVSDPVKDISFRFIRKIHVLSDGNIVVQNDGDHRLYEFTNDGELVSVIGSYGRGPGEFLNIWNSVVSVGDTLHIMGNDDSHKVFAKTTDGSWEFIRERTINYVPMEGLQRHFPDEMVLSDSEGNLYGIYHGFDESIGGQYRYVSSISYNLEQTGEVSRPFKTGDVAVLRSEENYYSVDNFRFFNAYYSYLPDTDEVIYVRNNSNEIKSIDASNNETIIGFLPFEQVPLNMNEVNGLLNYFRNQVPGSVSYLREKFLEYEPYYWRILLNDGRLFVHFERSEKDKPDWVITTLDGEILGSFHIPMYIQQLAVNGNRLFVATTGEDGTVYLAGYDLISSNH